MNLQSEFNAFSGNDSWSDFANLLGFFGLVDLGLIERIEDAHAMVQTFTLRGTEWRRISCEILMPGNLDGCLGEVMPGQLVLILVPRSPIANSSDAQLDTNAAMYAASCAKCIPLGVYNPKQPVHISTAGDAICISSDMYTKVYSTSQLQLLASKIQLQVDLETGEASLDWGEGKGCADLHNDGSYEIGSGYTYDKDNDKFNWKSHIKQSPDGSIVIEGAGLVNDSHESFGKNKLVLDTDGSIKIQAGIDKNGDIKSEIIVGADGTVSITNQDAYTISGVGVTIDGTSGKVSIKNAQANLFTDVLKAVLDKFNQGQVTTAGSPGSHNVVPSQFATEAAKLALLME